MELTNLCEEVSNLILILGYKINLRLRKDFLKSSCNESSKKLLAFTKNNFIKLLFLSE